MKPADPGRYLKLALPVPLPHLFDYLPPPGAGPVPVGARVVAPFGRRRLVGLVVAHSDTSEVAASKIMAVQSVLDDGQALLDRHMLELLDWCARYYRHAPGEVFFHALPPALRQSRGALPAPPRQFRLTDAGRARFAEGPGRAPVQHALLEQLSEGAAGEPALKAWRADGVRLAQRLQEHGWVASEPLVAPQPVATAGPELTAEQGQAVATIQESFGRFQAHLLDGVTGSGKTEVYLRLIAEQLQEGRQVLVLVPEIGLTPQLVRRFATRLGIEPATYHSACSEGERLATWDAARSGRAGLLLGTRSALFLPLPRAGLLIMDESHDSSFKQQEGFRFAARDVAVKRASDLGIPIVLGTATPSLETVFNAHSGRYGWSRLRRRATGARTPAWQIQDLRQLPTRGGLTESVLQSIGDTLARGEQVLVFLNRRGYAPVLLCHECGWHAACERCDANLTWHRAARTLVCHHCEARRPVPDLCPDCRADALHGAGEGTQQLERTLSSQFPEVPLYRFDRDQFSRKGSFNDMTDRVREGAPCILVGTQMLAKGHHFPAVTLAVVVNLDQALYSPDFRAIERMGQLLVQVAGRAGREERPGTVIVQTHHPDHPLLLMLIRDGYEAFAMALLDERRVAALPPYTSQACIRAEARGRDDVLAFLNRAAKCLAGSPARVHGPFAALMERRGGRLRWYLLLQSDQRSKVQAALAAALPDIRALPEARKVRWSVDVDPQSF